MTAESSAVITSNSAQSGVYPYDYVAYLLARASSCVSAEFHDELKRQGVPVSTWRILSSISARPRSVSRLAEMVLMQQPTLSKALDRLEEQGLVIRERRDESRRMVHVLPTAKGRALSDRFKPMAMAHEEKVLQQLNPEEARLLKSALRRLIDHYDGDKPD